MTDDTPTFFPTPTAESLYDLAREIAEFADAATEVLCYEDHTELLTLEAKLLAYAQLLTVLDRKTFLECEFHAAEQMLDAIHAHYLTPHVYDKPSENRLTTTAVSSHDLTSTSE